MLCVWMQLCLCYLDYGKQSGQWLPNKDGGNENYDAIALLQNINSVMESRNPSISNCGRVCVETE